MFIETLKTLKLYERRSKLGVYHTFRRKFTVYVFRCDSCGSIFLRPKSKVDPNRATKVPSGGVKCPTYSFCPVTASDQKSWNRRCGLQTASRDAPIYRLSLISTFCTVPLTIRMVRSARLLS